MRTLAVAPIVVRAGPPVALLREDGFLVSVEAAVLVRAVDGPALPNLAANAWVGAVAEAGRRAGFVGDFARGAFVGEVFEVS